MVPACFSASSTLVSSTPLRRFHHCKVRSFRSGTNTDSPRCFNLAEGAARSQWYRLSQFSTASLHPPPKHRLVRAALHPYTVTTGINLEKLPLQPNANERGGDCNIACRRMRGAGGLCRCVWRAPGRPMGNSSAKSNQLGLPQRSILFLPSSLLARSFLAPSFSSLLQASFFLTLHQFATEHRPQLPTAHVQDRNFATLRPPPAG